VPGARTGQGILSSDTAVHTTTDTGISSAPEPEFLATIAAQSAAVSLQNPDSSNPVVRVADLDTKAPVDADTAVPAHDTERELTPLDDSYI
jgi:hypothetical protein